MPDLSVLIVEDSFGRTYQRWLKNAGIPADVVLSGEEAVQVASSYQVIVMDTNLPGMKGYEACRMIKEKFPDVVVIGMSGSDYRSEWINAEANDFFLKETGIRQTLVEYVRRALAPQD